MCDDILTTPDIFLYSFILFEVIYKMIVLSGDLSQVGTMYVHVELLAHVQDMEVLKKEIFIN